MNAGSIEDDVPREKLSSHLQFSTPPSFSPKGIQEGTSPPSSILGASSSYTRNLASSNVPPLLSLSGDEETLLWPLLYGSNINSTGGSSLLNLATTLWTHTFFIHLQPPSDKLIMIQSRPSAHAWRNRWSRERRLSERDWSWWSAIF